MELVTPGIGLIFWTALFFLIVLALLRKFAWQPIVEGIDERNRSIQDALGAAEKAKEELSKLTADNEKLLQEARLERDKILRDAKAAADKLVSEAQTKATEEGQRLIRQAQETIYNEKMAALTEVKNQIANMSLALAEKILRNELGNKEAQTALIKDYMKDLKVN